MERPILLCVIVLWRGENPKALGYGEFVGPYSKRLDRLLESCAWEENIKESIKQRGLIIISRDYKENEPEADLFITAMHETIHSNRSLLLFDAVRDGTNLDSYTFNNGKFDQNISEYSESYGDASQDILKGNIDTSTDVVDGYSIISRQEMKKQGLGEEEREAKISRQVKVDEALAELMSILAYDLYNNKEKGQPITVWQAIERAKAIYKEEDVGVMCEIILKHKDFELFNWMLDPIQYSQGDVHYDFFEQYTRDDNELVERFYEACSPWDDWSLEDYVEGEVKKIATSGEAMGQLGNMTTELKQSLRDLRKEEI